MNKTKSKPRRRSSARKPKARIDETALATVKLARAHTEIENEYRQLWGRLVAPLERERRRRFLTGSLTEPLFDDLETRKSKAVKALRREYDRVLRKYDLVALNRAVAKQRTITDFEKVFDPDLIDRLRERLSSGGRTLVQGDHPCCSYYASTAQAPWQGDNAYFYPADYSLTSHFFAWLTPSKFQVKFHIDGEHDNEWSQKYTQEIWLHATFDAVSRGQVGFQMRFEFNNAALYGRGGPDGIFGLGTPDGGWAGAFYFLQIRRIGADPQTFVTRNQVLGSRHYGSEFVSLREVWETHSLNQAGAPWGSNAPIFTPIPSTNWLFLWDNEGRRFGMSAGDRFSFFLVFRFEAQAFGDEEATGGVNVKDMNGGQGFCELPPIEVLLEECA